MNNKSWVAAGCAVLALLGGCKNKGEDQNSTNMRVLNAVADSEPLDVLVDDDAKVSALAFGATSSYSQFNSGSRNVKVRSSTANTVLSEKSLSFANGAYHTLFVFGKRASILSQLVADDTTSPSSGNFRVRVVNLAPDTGAVDLYLTSGDISSSSATIAGTAYSVTTGSAEVTSGSLRVTLTTSGTQDILFQSAPIALSSGTGYTVVAVPSLGGKLTNAVLMTAGSSGTATSLANPLARVKAVNAIADSTGVNFKADGTTLLSAVPFTGSSSYVSTATGSRTLQLEASNVPGTIIASATKQLDAARDYTMLATGSLASPQLVTLNDDNSLPTAGLARIRFAQALAGSPTVDVLLNFASQASGVAYGAASTYYQVTPSTSYTITFTSPGGVTVLATLTPVQLDAGAIYTAYLFGTPGNAQAKLVRDR